MFTRPVAFAIALVVVLGRGAVFSQSPAPRGSATPEPKDPLSALWVEPTEPRDLFYGVGGKRLAPDPGDVYRVIEIKVGGFSEGYTVLGRDDREWSVKFPPEAAIEVTLSRIHWGLGYQQPPVYFLPAWTADGAKGPNPQLPGRFREDAPDLHGMDSSGSWRFDDNAFVGTRQLRGLLVLQALLENQDIKASNNTIYTLKTPVDGASRWYTVRDLGYSLGRAGFNGPRGDIDAFEQAPFIKGVVDGTVQFHFGSRYKKLLAAITPEDVRWICDRVSRLTDRQWRDAFRAGGFEPTVADRFIARIKARAAEGLALSRTAAPPPGRPAPDTGA